MTIKTTYCSAIALFSILLSSSVLADDVYVCQHADNQRIISVVYTEEGSTVPCEVTYEKSTGSEVLWSAQGEEGYCEAKAEAFVEKQRSWGWDCSSDDSSVADTAEEVAEELTEDAAMEPEAGDEMASEPVVTESEMDSASEIDDSESVDSVVAE